MAQYDPDWHDNIIQIVQELAKRGSRSESQRPLGFQVENDNEPSLTDLPPAG